MQEWTKLITWIWFGSETLHVCRFIVFKYNTVWGKQYWGIFNYSTITKLQSAKNYPVQILSSLKPYMYVQYVHMSAV